MKSNAYLSFSNVMTTEEEKQRERKAVYVCMVT